MDEKSPAQERQPSSLRVGTKTRRSRFSAQKKKGVTCRSPSLFSTLRRSFWGKHIVQPCSKLFDCGGFGEHDLTRPDKTLILPL